MSSGVLAMGRKIAAVCRYCVRVKISHTDTCGHTQFLCNTQQVIAADSPTGKHLSLYSHGCVKQCPT